MPGGPVIQNARYSGSTWYYDHHWEDLKENCVAHINMDICGCKGSDVVGMRTSMLEGEAFDREFLREFNDKEPEAPTPMVRFADQTFWGADIPFAMMPQFIKQDHKTFPGGIRKRLPTALQFVQPLYRHRLKHQ